MGEKERLNQAELLEKTELVIDDNTIYEIDLECLDCLHRSKRNS